jgi:hypothetical protein
LHELWAANNSFSPAAASILTPSPMAPSVHTLHLSRHAARHCCVRDGLQSFSGQTKTAPTCTFIFTVGGHCTLQEVLQMDTALPLISHSWQGQQLICLLSAGIVESKINYDNCLHRMASNTCDCESVAWHC